MSRLYRELGFHKRDEYVSYWTTHRERKAKRRLAVWSGVCMLISLLLTVAMMWPFLYALFGRP